MTPLSRRSRRPFTCAAVVGLLLVSALASGTAPVSAQETSTGDFLSIESGRDAIDSLGADLPAVAAENGLSAAELRAELGADPTLSVDRNGELFYVDPPAPDEPDTPAPATTESGPEASPPTTDPVFFLHSRPGANHTIYLDFDGHITSGTTWNTANSIDPIESPAYNISGTPDTWSASELTRIRDIFNRVVEDYSPFNVDVTTQEPPVEMLRRVGGADTQWGVRVVFTADTWANCGCGGHAYIGAFDDNTDEPAFVYNSSLVGAAEGATHEVGHTLLLAHDGTSSVSYYQGHGSGATSWAPLMGASYYTSVTQWSKGDYDDANNNTSSANYGNGADDLAVIANLTNGNGFGYRVDDHGNTIGAATPLAGSELTATGVIETAGDRDIFSFATEAGSWNIAVAPWAGSANLDINARLLDDTGTEIASSNPAASLDASFDQVLAAGTYFVTVDGTGVGSPLSSPPSGYSEHASLGQYTITGTTVPAPTGPITGTLTADGNGDPIGGASVTATSLSTGLEVSTSTEDDGTYALSVGPGNHLIRVVDPTGHHLGEYFDDIALDQVEAAVPVPAGTDGVAVSLESTTTQVPCSNHPLTDVPLWADPAVVWASCASHMTGFGNLFKSFNSTTRAQVASLLFSVAGRPDVSELRTHDLSDVPPWIDDAVTWLVANNYATGFATSPPTFKPNNSITRAAVSRMLFRIEDSPPNSRPHAFGDVPTWADAAVDWITDPANTPQYATGFGTVFRPLDSINRAQITRMVCRINTTPGTC